MIKVLVIDDSALIRQVLTELINRAPDLTVVGAVGDAYAARDFIRQSPPDVLTLDIEMPRMDGLTFLQKLMKGHPMPVVMVSTLTESGAEATLQALDLGAVDFIAKPKLDVRRELGDYQAVIHDKLRAAAAVTRFRATQKRVIKPIEALGVSTEHILAIGASTGGTEAIKAVLTALPADAPGTVVTQHMPSGFTRTFAERLNRNSALEVREAQGHERILPGQVFIAPGNRHLTVVRSGSDFQTRLVDSEQVQGHRPSVDVLFQSVADACGANAVGVILTGMGKDGAAGLLSMYRGGCYTLAQDEASCVVYGMPRVALEAGGVTEVQALDDIPDRLIKHWHKVGAGHRI
ncbi:chemotaxis response regulator protein-glutamate methylesterase [Saccharospirillum sp. MSK14-1]|uniref:protein-glutamate methylesterase/protein-glutamine glutaminase n=1 Tax=Saccharospirillum sp. MSK14-1 TaxID=1897632 RepID=UPI000D393FED|nr:chemotaxis response regulator protein-glutamate methylesterase [Saccharospirillum sp. MSK14-1]PTY37474.1 chemotaxis response regulator protein-glutamate methylesterase [Saccharospirillum sp. MSK14-1]